MRYREVIHTPLWLLAIIYLFMLSLVISIWAALGNNSALITFVLLTFSLFWIYFSSALIIEVDDTELRVGRAHIALQFVGECSDLDNQAIRRIRTRDADLSAFLAIRFWATRGISMAVNDKRDSTPYWLISCKKGSDLIRALKS